MVRGVTEYNVREARLNLQSQMEHYVQHLTMIAYEELVAESEGNLDGAQSLTWSVSVDAPVDDGT